MPASRKAQIMTVVSMAAITAMFTAVVATVQAVTSEDIEVNQRLKEVRGAFDAFGIGYSGDMTSEQLEALAEERLKPKAFGDLASREVVDVEGNRVGYIFPIGGSGFWGPISGYLALDTTGSRIVGISFVRHSETPGLGARITEDWFRSQFKGKSIAPAEGRGLAIRLVQEGKPKGPNDVDAITGATGTSRGVEKFLNDNLAQIRAAMKP